MSAKDKQSGMNRQPKVPSVDTCETFPESCDGWCAPAQLLLRITAEGFLSLQKKPTHWINACCGFSSPLLLTSLSSPLKWKTRLRRHDSAFIHQSFAQIFCTISVYLGEYVNLTLNYIELLMLLTNNINNTSAYATTVRETTHLNSVWWHI